MKTKIIIGSLLAVFILAMLPSISAVEFNTVANVNKSKIDMLIDRIQNNERFKDFDIDKLQNIIDDWVPGETLYILFFLFLMVLYVILTWLQLFID